MMPSSIEVYYKIIARNIVSEAIVDIESFILKLFYKGKLKLFTGIRKIIIGTQLYQYWYSIH